MKVYFNRSEKIMEKWPDPYWYELKNKLCEKGHCVTDEVSEADAYVGPVDSIYKSFHGRRIGLLGPTLEGEGVKSPIICAGCKEKLENQVDCIFQDELCMLEITPNDVMRALCEL